MAISQQLDENGTIFRPLNCTMMRGIEDQLGAENGCEVLVSVLELLVTALQERYDGQAEC